LIYEECFLLYTLALPITPCKHYPIQVDVAHLWGWS